MTHPSQPGMTRLNIFKVSIVNLAVALLTLPLGSILNRVMMTELALPATLVAIFLALGNLSSPLRIWFGRISDTRPIGNLHRTWYIVLGIGLMAIGLAAAPLAIYVIPSAQAVGLLLTFLAFALVGLGINSTTPLYFALVSDQANETQRPRIMAFMFVLLGVGVVMASLAMGGLLDPFSPQRLAIVIAGLAALAVLLAAVGLWKLEKPAEARPRQETRWNEVRDLLVRNREVLRFFLYLVLTFIAIDAQDVLLEPYAAGAFGMLPGETTRLTGILRGGFILTLIAGALLVNRFGHKATALGGIGLAAAGLGLIIASGSSGAAGLFLGSVFLLGLGNGMLTIANLSLMVDMTDHQHAGLYIGVWGFAQAVGVGSASLVGGLLRDIIYAVTGNWSVSYVSVFGLEILLLAVSVPFLVGLSLARFRENTQRMTLTQSLAATAEN